MKNSIKLIFLNDESKNIVEADFSRLRSICEKNSSKINLF